MRIYPIPPNEAQRLKALQNYAILDSIREDEFDRITELASLICDVPMALVSFIDHKRQWFKSQIGLEGKEIYRELSFCQYTIMDTELFEVDNALEDTRFSDNDFVRDGLKIRFYAGYPLVDPEGYALGTLSVIGQLPHTLTDKQKRSLKLLADEVVALLVERRHKVELKHFEKIFRLSEDLICVTGFDGIFKKVNPAFAKVLGWDSNFLFNTSIFDLIHPDDLKDSRQEIMNLMEGISSVNFIHRLRSSSGQYKHIEWTATPELSSGDLFAVGRDITEFKIAEQELNSSRKLLDDILRAASEVSIIATDLDNKITVFNSGAERLLGYSADEIVGKQSVKIFHTPEDIAHLNRKFGVDIHKDEEPSEDFNPNAGDWKEFTYVRKDGSYLIVSLMITTIRDTSNKEIGYLGIAVDITSAVRQREELKMATMEAEHANMAKSEFLANMSHEIRTPLNGVIGFTDLVLKTVLTGIQQQYLGIVNQSATALLGIINDILDFSKIEAGKLELDIEKADIYEMVDQTMDIIAFPLQHKDLEMLLNLSPELPRFIWTDVIRLKQILINLLGNAAKFTEKGEIELKIDVLSVMAQESTLRITVRDTGIGIAEGKQKKIFEAFSQEDGSTTKKYGGTGLGLTISNKLLGLMGSKLQLQSASGMGSLFYFDLTVKSEEGEPVPENIELVKKVLIVDDNDNNRQILSQMLLLKNIEAVEARNGYEAMQRLAEGESFDTIIMDYHMPYISGIETIRKIRNQYHEAENQSFILLHSSSDDEDLISACEELRVNHRLVKPVRMQDFYAVLSRLFTAEKPVLKASVNIPVVHTILWPLKILIAEDNDINMLLLKTVLKRIAPNAVLIAAVNGLEALNYYESNAVDLIFMDIQMPEMNGYEATIRIRAIEKAGYVPIIAITAGNSKNEMEKCLKGGMDDIIVKPFIEETIANVINKWFEDKLSAI